jgi:hypothetical protein
MTNPILLSPSPSSLFPTKITIIQSHRAISQKGNSPLKPAGVPAAAPITRVDVRVYGQAVIVLVLALLPPHPHPHCGFALASRFSKFGLQLSA